MSTNTSIEWTDATWNCIRGCSRVSEGCRHCYAERVAARFSSDIDLGNGRSMANPATKPALYDGLAIMGSDGPHWTGEVRFIKERLADPLRWKKPRRVFVNSMSDLFHEKVQDPWIDRIFAVMALCPQHTFQVLTKRPERMLAYFRDNGIDPGRRESLYSRVLYAAEPLRADMPILCAIPISNPIAFPLRNLWLGVSCEDQKTADERIPLLLQTPAEVRFISYEPALGPLDLDGYLSDTPNDICIGETAKGELVYGNGLDWIIVGGESGPGARPFEIEWARDVITQCDAAGVSCFVKQLGANVITRNDTGFEGDTPRSWPMDTRVDDSEDYQGAPCRVYLLDRKGGDWNEWPEDLRVREFPEARA